jgi:cobalamin biosynthesis protein CobT
LPAGCEKESAEAEKNGMDRTLDIVNRWVFKSFDETYAKAFPRFGSMSVGMNTKNMDSTGSVGGCNVDHEVILWGASRLWQQLPDRKIQIVLSDGQPSGYGHDYGGLLDRMLCLTNSKIVRSGIEQYCFSIQSDCCRHYYKHWKIINNIEDLNSEALKFLASAANLKGTARY